ncbi:MAG TPA: Uma2 family endonuclease [Thermodesulfovibrionia bacterium]|nr:Uma2 family endonuclease [Thermodesulfovibrionia bacterium]
MKAAILKEKKYTYQDYLHFPDNERWEIIDGIAYDMSPAPKIKHQRIVSKLDRILGNLVEEHGCTLFIAPTDVVFDNFNVVQPDVFVVCDKSKITVDNIQGAPDLIIEVISKSTSLTDRRDKKKLYEKFGVEEYIMVYPDNNYVERYTLKNWKYEPAESYRWNEIIKLNLFNIEIRLWEIFEKDVV